MGDVEKRSWVWSFCFNTCWKRYREKTSYLRRIPIVLLNSSSMVSRWLGGSYIYWEFVQHLSPLRKTLSLPFCWNTRLLSSRRIKTGEGHSEDIPKDPYLIPWCFSAWIFPTPGCWDSAWKLTEFTCSCWPNWEVWFRWHRSSLGFLLSGVEVVKFPPQPRV